MGRRRLREGSDQTDYPLRGGIFALRWYVCRRACPDHNALVKAGDLDISFIVFEPQRRTDE